MATTVSITVDNTTYELGFSKLTIKQMSDAGFVVEEARKDYVKGIPQLFAGSFLLNHRTVSSKEIDDIWDRVPDKFGFADVLITMYNEQLEKLFGDPEDESKKAMWEVVKR